MLFRSQGTGPTFTVGWWLAGASVATLLVVAVYGTQLWSATGAVGHQREAQAAQLQQLKGQIQALTEQRARAAGTHALRQEVEVLGPQAVAARGLVDALRASTSGGETLGQTLAAVAGVSEPGLWMTHLQLSDGGRVVDVQGGAREAAVALRYARRVNDALAPQGLRLDHLELQPARPAQGASAAQATGLGFHLN